MQTIKLNNRNFKEIIKLAIKTLKNNGVIVYPTETAYGLGTLAFNKPGVKRIYFIKGRIFKKPLSVLMPSLNMANKYLQINSQASNLIKKYWPGPLTLVLPIKKLWLKKFLPIVAGKKELAIRISSNKFAAVLVRKLNQPLTATSANLSGAGEIYEAKKIIDIFQKRKYQPDLVIQAGKLTKRLPSTIIKIEKNKIKILRQGEILLKQ